MIKKILDIKLNVKPIFIMFEHKYYFEGPCRMAGGDALQPGFDAMVNGAIFNGTMEGIQFSMPDCVNLLEPGCISTTCDWDIKDSYYEELLKDEPNVDVYLCSAGFGTDKVFMEFAERCNKTIMMMPDIWGPAIAGYLYNTNKDVVMEATWPEVARRMVVLRAKKAIREANLLLVNRFNNDIPVAGASYSFTNLRAVTEKLGTHFRTVNAHEILDQFHPMPEEGNHTTPGRVTPNITEEEIAELEKVADEIFAGAKEVEIEKDMMVKSLIANKVIQKNLDLYDCSGCVIPCPDICSTRRMNQEKFTFCLNHSLNLEQGIPSACEYDVAAAVTMIAEIAISGKAPYMGNTLPVMATDPRGINFQLLQMLREEEYEEVKDMDNLYVVFHSTPHRKFKGINEPDGSYAIRHFAYDQKFGAVMRHDFDEDKGQEITLARFSGDLKRMMIAKGKIVKSIGYDLCNCNGGFLFQVEDQQKMYHEQWRSGLHMPLVFGDYTEELKMLAESYGMEAILV